MQIVYFSYHKHMLKTEITISARLIAEGRVKTNVMYYYFVYNLVQKSSNYPRFYFITFMLVTESPTLRLKCFFFLMAVTQSMPIINKKPYWSRALECHKFLENDII